MGGIMGILWSWAVRLRSSPQKKTRSVLERVYRIEVTAGQ
jgi:hypothetical protein